VLFFFQTTSIKISGVLIIDIHKLLISQIVFCNCEKNFWIIKIFSHTTSLRSIFIMIQALDSISFYAFDSIIDWYEDSRFYYWKIIDLNILPKHQRSAKESLNIISSMSHVWPSTLYANNSSLKEIVHLNIIIFYFFFKCVDLTNTNNTKR